MIGPLLAMPVYFMKKTLSGYLSGYDKKNIIPTILTLNKFSK